MSGNDILNRYNYYITVEVDCNQDANLCPGNFECWNFDHHIFKIKKFLEEQHETFNSTICIKCFIVMYIDLARLVFSKRCALKEDFLSLAIDLYELLYYRFEQAKTPKRFFRSHFFYVLVDALNDFTQYINYTVQYAFAVEALALYTNIVNCWTKCSRYTRCIEHAE